MVSEEAKTIVQALRPPPEYGLSIDQAMTDLLSPVVAVLRNAGLQIELDSLADDSSATLARIGGFKTVAELDENVSRVFDEEEQSRFLSARAAQWHNEIRLLAVLARIGPADTRANIRETHENVSSKLPNNPSSPTDLRDALDTLLGDHPQLAMQIGEHLAGTANVAAPDRDELLAWAQQDGIATGHLDSVRKALEAPRRERARALRTRSQQLEDHGVRPVSPPALREMASKAPLKQASSESESKPKLVRAIKVGEQHDRRKRELGDEGEQWALAAVIGRLIGLDHLARDAAIEQIVHLLRWFKGSPVDQSLSHAPRARMKDLDEEELAEELVGLLLVASYSDAFGFDLIGWLPHNLNGEGQAVCLEVKSSGGKGFHLSRNEWSVAERLHDEGYGDQYAVLVVRRGKDGGVPNAMDLLRDPVSLEKAGLLRCEVDGYHVGYSSADS